MTGALLLLVACGPEIGDWDGMFDASNAMEPWPVRLIDVVDAGPTTDEEDGRVGWQQWRGTYELRADDGHWVGPMKAYVCEEDSCAAGETTSDSGAVWMFADLNAGNFACDGTLDGDTITCDGQRILPGNPSIGPVTFTRAAGNLRVGDL